jgi:hypothetical protein
MPTHLINENGYLEGTLKWVTIPTVFPTLRSGNRPALLIIVDLDAEPKSRNPP